MPNPVETDIDPCLVNQKPFATLLELADFLEGLPDDRFDMSNPYIHECGSAGCIGGWVVAVNFGNEVAVELEEAMTRAFGIPKLDARMICYPGEINYKLGRKTGEEVDCYDASNKEVAVMLRHYAEHGDVVDAWGAALC